MQESIIAACAILIVLRSASTAILAWQLTRHGDLLQYDVADA